MSQPQTLRSRLLTIDASGICVLGVMLALAYYFGLSPVLNARAEVQQHRLLLETEARNAADVEGRIVREQKKLAEWQAKLDATKIQLDPVSELNRRLQRISALWAEHGLEVRQIEPGTPQPDPDSGRFLTVPIRLTGVGSYTGLSGFLHELLVSVYPDVEVRTMTVASSPDSTGKTENGATFAIELRWYAAPAAGAGAAAAAPAK